MTPPRPMFRVPMTTIIQRLHDRLWTWASLPPQDGRRVLGLETNGGHIFRLRQNALGVFLEKWTEQKD